MSLPIRTNRLGRWIVEADDDVDLVRLGEGGQDTSLGTQFFRRRLAKTSTHDHGQGDPPAHAGTLSQTLQRK
jgi:hypothetical protein